jgi:hypothetical protein
MATATLVVVVVLVAAALVALLPVPLLRAPLQPIAGAFGCGLLITGCTDT